VTLRWSSRSRWRWSAALLPALLWGCASRPAWQAAAPSTALPPVAAGRFTPTATQIAVRHGADASGFHLLERNAEGLLWPLASDY
jgi:hypothetical protein